MAPKAKQRRILVKLVSTALTGYFYTTSRIRVSDKLAKIKYDPIEGKARRNLFFDLVVCLVKRHVLFTETKIK
ncbi:ribosomal protein L33 [Kwoniella mangroviensis CBS 10435]|uniref:Large ribosomal subunit protein bL33m n=1 Tax=Kwoniella mangroviensis CBS 10435 TaxID=1331196 RepID=A0A1B9ISY6_9TREE|nr:ribosomal protein L33 [Kwoniella mangroviensis CBS 8507]OCF58636.1 ribosomal protein L33 [Kwoniella mangroviensis CBS 10435]OCF68428.1 ribosomal protein L33 [Kwoniella mangroviensis CBS 8507]